MGLDIVLIEDDTSFAETLERFLRKEGHVVVRSAEGERGVAVANEGSHDLVLLDLQLPDMDGLAALERIKAAEHNTDVIVMTAHGSIETAVNAMRLGAVDYVVKPIDLESLSLRLHQVEQVLRLRSELDYLLDRQRQGHFEELLGDCPAMRELYKRIEVVAHTDNTTVLVTGESGTGKELVARALHARSTRSGKPLIQVDCTAIPLHLMESELFGHERGAFSGADRLKRGLLEVADNGTLLLDEIGDMDLALQAKLLRVLEERRFRRVGGTRDLPFDVRVVAATNQNLNHLTKAGRFRQELLYRLRVFEIRMPPLRERGADVITLAEAFAARFARSFRKPIIGLDEDAREMLLRYPFPGNVRELRNMMEQAVILATGETIGRELLPLQDRASGPPGMSSWPAERLSSAGKRIAIAPLQIEALGDKPLEKAERVLIEQAIKQSSGNKKAAAQLLGISRFALQRKLEKLGF